MSHRKKIGNIEIDLIFQTQKKQMVLVEVKSISSNDRASFRWGYDQRKKFMYVLERVNATYRPKEIYGVLALVAYNELSFFYLDET